MQVFSVDVVFKGFTLHCFHLHITTVCVNSGCGEVAMEWGGGVAQGHVGHALHHLVHGLGATGARRVRCHHYDNCTSNTQLRPT